MIEEKEGEREPGGSGGRGDREGMRGGQGIGSGNEVGSGRRRVGSEELGFGANWSRCKTNGGLKLPMLVCVYLVADTYIHSVQLLISGTTCFW